MYLWKWSLIWLTAVEISQQSNNSPVLQSRAVKYYSDKSSKFPFSTVPAQEFPTIRGRWELRKGQKEMRNDFPLEGTTGHPTWWPDRGREAKEQRLWDIKKCCRKFHHIHSIFTGSQPSPCNLLAQERRSELAMLLTAAVGATHPACGEGRRWPMEEKSHRSRELKVRAGTRALATWGKSRLACSNRNITI